MAGEKYNEYKENNPESKKEEIDAAITHAQLDLNKLQSAIIQCDKKTTFTTPDPVDSINNFYSIEWNKTIVFNLNQVKNYLNAVNKRLSWMQVQKFWEISKENNFTWTILAIQIALKAIDSKKYNIWKINWEYSETTKQAIKQFQTDKKLTRQDWKPWKETINILTKNLEALINSKRLEANEQEVLKKDISDIIEESCRNNPYSWAYTPKKKEEIINYIIEWNLKSWKDQFMEMQITSLSQDSQSQKFSKNWKLKYLLEHSWESLKDNINKIKLIENQGTSNTAQTPRRDKQPEIKNYFWWSDKYTFWHNLTESQKGTITNVLSGWKSPVTAKMVADSCQTSKNVPVEYLLAFMQNDSRVWTVWRWARTHNPGNVWNTNKWTKDWWTWERGVDACAENLQKRIDAYLDAKAQYNGKWFNDFPTPEELATWKAKWWFRFFWIYMSAPSGPRKVAGMVKTWVNRLRWN